MKNNWDRIEFLDKAEFLNQNKCMKKKYKLTSINTKEQAIKEAYRYLENAKETLSKIPIEDGMKHAKEIVDMFKDAAWVISLD